MIVVCVAALVAIMRFVHSHRKPPISVAVAGAEPVQPPDHTTTPVVTPAQNSMDTQRDQERAKIFEQIKNELTAEGENVSKFKVHCTDLLTRNCALIGYAASSNKDALDDKNKKILNAMSDVVGKQENYLNSMQIFIQKGVTNPKVNPQKTLELLRTKYSQMEKSRQEINKEANDMYSEIMNAASAQ